MFGRLTTKQTKQFTRDFDKVVDWVKMWHNVGVEIVSRKETQYDPQEGKIFIEKKLDLRHRLYYLLHEVGHVVVDSRGSEYQKKFVKSWGSKAIRGKQARVEVLREEVLAWEFGSNVAEQLGIEIDYKFYNRYITKNLFSYISWVIFPGKWV
jgi:hypothetical protein